MTAPSSTISPAAGNLSIPSVRQQFLDVLQREHQTTMRVIRAFPESKADFRPHPDSNSAKNLVWTFAVELTLLDAALRNALELGKGFPPAPETWGECVAAYQSAHQKTVAQLERMRDDEISGTVRFFTGPGQMGDIPKAEFLWFMLFDQIHHRGQLSVYVRMAGGKVPSIYGPSKDEPWM